MRGVLGRFLKSSDGSFIPLLAFSLVPLLLAVGVATDYGMGVTTRSSMQSALDASTVALTTMPQSASDSERLQLLQKMYAANGGEGVALLKSDSFDADGTFHASTTASYQMPTNFMKLAMVDSVPVSVASAVIKSPTLINATFKIEKASGYWNKTITLYGTPFGSTKASPLMQITYVYNGAGGAKGYGTTTILTPNSRGKMTSKQQQQVCNSTTYNPYKSMPSGSFVDGGNLVTCSYTVGSASSGASVDVSQMSDLYLEMDVPSGSPSVLKSNDPTTSDRLFISGIEVPNGKVVDIFTAVPCGQTSEQAWEDGGSPVPGLVQDADFFYNVTGKCDYTQRVANTRFTQ